MAAQGRLLKLPANGPVGGLGAQKGQLSRRRPGATSFGKLEPRQRVQPETRCGVSLRYLKQGWEYEMKRKGGLLKPKTD